VWCGSAVRCQPLVERGDHGDPLSVLFSHGIDAELHGRGAVAVDALNDAANFVEAPRLWQVRIAVGRLAPDYLIDLIGDRLQEAGEFALRSLRQGRNTFAEDVTRATGVGAEELAEPKDEGE
jgi:hypothetical protein